MKKIIRMITGMMAAFMIIAAFAVPAKTFASENVPVTVNIPLTYIVDGNAKTAGGDSFTLIPDSEETPMPDGQIGGTKTIDVTGEGISYFGDITYERPDIYMYTVERDLTKKKGVTKDDSVYRVKVIALNNGEGYIITTFKGDDAKAELVYRDRVAPQTGDTNELMYMGITFGISAVLLLCAVSVKRRNS